MPQQGIVCQAAGNPDGAPLWWFVDGAPAGESEGSRPFKVDMSAGEHVISCATEDGVSASVNITVLQDAQNS